VADQLAAKGYIAIAPDFLSGMGPNGGKSSDFPSVDAAREANSKLDPDQVMADLNAAADYAKKIPAADGKLAVVGFCWGGSMSFRFAANRKDLNAAFVFYGTAPKDVSPIAAPVYGFYAGNDARVGATIPDTTAAMKTAGKKYDPITYEGAGHGFMRAGEDPGNTNPDNKKAHDQAWERWLKLLKTL
jgi:carboxymethylenebutenolidase